jgi:hypothetical protein
MKTSDVPNYLSYLLRLWLENGEEGISWRVSLESTETGERVGFANMDLMVEYLNQKTKSTGSKKGKSNHADTKDRV